MGSLCKARRIKWLDCVVVYDIKVHGMDVSGFCIIEDGRYNILASLLYFVMCIELPYPHIIAEAKLERI